MEYPRQPLGGQVHASSRCLHLSRHVWNFVLTFLHHFHVLVYYPESMLVITVSRLLVAHDQRTSSCGAIVWAFRYCLDSDLSPLLLLPKLRNKPTRHTNCAWQTPDGKLKRCSKRFFSSHFWIFEYLTLPQKLRFCRHEDFHFQIRRTVASTGTGPGLRSRSTGADNLRPVFHFLIFKKMGGLSHFFFSNLQKRRERENGMSKGQVSSVGNEEVLHVEIKWSFLPITPTYDQYVQWWVTMSEREGFLSTISPVYSFRRVWSLRFEWHRSDNLSDW